MDAPRSFLVTGGNGFLGTTVVERLLAEGARVVVASRTGVAPAGAEAVRVDLASADAARRLHAVEAEAAVHLAGINDARVARADPERARAANALAVGPVLDWATARGAHVAVAGSVAQYGRPVDDPIREETPQRPLDPYGASKAEQERIAFEAAASRGTSVAVLRIFNVLGRAPGRGDFTNRLCDATAEAARRKAPAEFAHGDLDVVRDLVAREDVADAIVDVARGRAHGAFNVCTGRGASFRDVAAAIAAAAPVPVALRLEPAFVRPHDPRRLVGSPEKLRALGWRPRRSWETTVRAMLDAALEGA